MREARLDVAVDCQGHSRFSQLAVFAQRVAPLQVSAFVCGSIDCMRAAAAQSFYPAVSNA